MIRWIAWLVLATGPGLAVAQVAQEANGYWTGTISVPGIELGVAVTLERNGDAWTGAVDLAEQGIRGLELTGVAIDDRNVRFGLPRIPGSPLFDGKLSSDGKTLSGDFIQHEERFPFELVRGVAPAESDQDLFRDYTRPGVPGEGLEGTWNGVLNGGPARLRMSLTLARDDGGRLGGSLYSVDQRDARLRVTGVAQMNEIILIEIDSIGAILNVRLAADGATLNGAWEQEQAGLNLPIVLHRAP